MVMHAAGTARKPRYLGNSPPPQQPSPHPTHHHDVPDHQLATPTRLDLAVHLDGAVHQQRLGVGAAVDEVRELEELAEPDRLVADRDVLGRAGHESTNDTAWITTPTRPPTMVPLIRMNCRSRPTCSSILRAASWPSQRSMVWVITLVTSEP